MKIDIFCELQKPRPWDGDHEQQIIEETIEQAKLADEMGYSCFWEVEHHTAEEFSYSSAPELMLTAIAQNTERIRLGHAAVLAPFNFNHPVRIAERSAFLDRLSRGRLEMGFARSTAMEWQVFNVDPDDTRRQLQDTMQMVPRMWQEERFSWKSKDWEINDRVILPKPLQKPHPPMWQACSSEPSWVQAGQNGVGVLGVTLWTSIDEIERRIRIYREAVKDANPVGAFVNNQVALFTFVHCAETEQQAIDNGAAAAAAWYTNAAFNFFQARDSEEKTAPEAQDSAGSDFVGGTADALAAGEPTEAEQVIGRVRAGEDVSNEEIFQVLSEQDSLIVGDPETCRRKMKRYEEIGIDRLMCFQQVGQLTHDQIMGSIRQVGQLIPEFEGSDISAGAR